MGQSSGTFFHLSHKAAALSLRDRCGVALSGRICCAQSAGDPGIPNGRMSRGSGFTSGSGSIRLRSPCRLASPPHPHAITEDESLCVIVWRAFVQVYDLSCTCGMAEGPHTGELFHHNLKQTKKKIHLFYSSRAIFELGQDFSFCLCT